MKHLVILTALVLSACGKSGSGEHVDAALQPYVDDYKTVTEGKGYYPPTWTVTLVDDSKEGRAGVCEGDARSFTVSLSRHAWENYDADSRRSLVFHEMSHCVFGAQHTQDENNFMYPYTVEMSRDTLVGQVRLLVGLY